MNSELEDSDLEFLSKNKQKFNANIIRNKLIQMFKRKSAQSTATSNKISNTTSTHITNLNDDHPRHRLDHQSDVEDEEEEEEEEEEDLPSNQSDSTIPVDQWSIESVPKPGFTPVEHLQILKSVRRI